MAENLLSSDPADDDYIDMEVSSYRDFFSNSKSSPPHHPREFEFQMNSSCLKKEPTTSPADELFYKGKLLPLHLPPRLQMVEKLLENSIICAYDHQSKDTFLLQDFYSTPVMTNAVATPTTTSTPFESCNISPAESCQVSRELNPNEYFFEHSSEVSGLIGGDNPKKKSWTKKLKLIKQSSLGSKLKASRAYLKSLFGKSGCSDESCTDATTKVADDEGTTTSKVKESFIMNYTNVANKKPFGQIQTENSDSSSCHRRSFSMAIKWNSKNKSSSSSSASSGSSSSLSSSNDSNGFNDELQFLKRTSSSAAYMEIESSIQGAIAHCKQSQTLQPVHSGNTLSSLSAFDDRERAELCRG